MGMALRIRELARACSNEMRPIRVGHVADFEIAADWVQKEWRDLSSRRRSGVLCGINTHRKQEVEGMPQE